MKKVAVLMGGRSEEREVSLRTGSAVISALKKKGYTTREIDTKEASFITELQNFNPDVVFIALHGPYGEDGTVQGLLEIMGIPYCGCGVLASAIAMNKIFTKRMLKYENIPTADFEVVNIYDYQNNKKEIIENLFTNIKIPMVVKAPCQGSTIGIYFVKKSEQLEDSLQKAFKFDNDILVEKFIEGKEVTVAIIGNENPVALPIIEIVSHTGVYDYKAKYTKGLSDHIIPAKLPDNIQELIKKLAVKTFKTLNCRGFARVDFIVDSNNNPYVLEVNTIPGMTETSLLPDAASAAGIPFEELIHYFIRLASGENVQLDL